MLQSRSIFNLPGAIGGVPVLCTLGSLVVSAQVMISYSGRMRLVFQAKSVKLFKFTAMVL